MSEEELLREYQALRGKVDAFCQAARARRPQDLACRRGCDGCCQVELTLCPAEAEAVARALRALPRERLAALGRRQGACACLTEEGACAIYADRPLVCRTQGLALRYPSGLVPEAAVRARATASDAIAGDVTWCPLNFTAASPAAEDVLDAERVDALLALVSRRFAEHSGAAPLRRRPVRALVQEALDRTSSQMGAARRRP